LAEAAAPSETGGLLLGWWIGDSVVARYAVEVRDPSASDISWTRSPESAQKALDYAVLEFDHLWLGYVGDWHSHLAPLGASRQDLDSIRRASRQYAKPLVLLIHHADGIQDIRCATRGRLRSVNVAPYIGS